MKYYFLKSLAMIVLIVLAATGCKDRNAEKRIAALENEIKELKGSKQADHADHTITPASTPEEAKPEGPLAAINFVKTEHDFGTIKEGDVVEHTFEFTNNGEAPLLIQNAQASCGCTVPDWTKTPVPVGGKGFVKAKFDSSGKPNMQNKTVTVTANTYPTQTVLRFKVMVTPKAQQPDAGPLNQ
jgi:hypothetical protein